MHKKNWSTALELNEARQVTKGSTDDLLKAIRNGADLRIYTEFRHNEHIDTNSDSKELIKEVADFRITYLLDEQWVAGIINLRQPVALPDSFGARPSMSFFLYNQDATQAIARPYLDGLVANGPLGSYPPDDHSAMPRYHQRDGWDSATNAPSSNFVYDFDLYRFWVSDTWTEVYAHDENGNGISGSVAELEKAFESGMEVKVGIRGLCDDLVSDGNLPLQHEVFVHCGSCYYYTEKRQFCAASQPVVRVTPNIPLEYRSQGWDFGWLIPQTDGKLARWLVNPYTLEFTKGDSRHAIRWFVR